MKSTLGLFTLACGVFTDLALAMSRDKIPNARNGYHLAVPPEEMTEAADTIYNSTFQQLIDHDNPSLGTFSQFYYWSTEFWKGPGSPVVFFTPGEVEVVGYQHYLQTVRTTGVIAQEIGAAIVVIEHRYWGFSSPFQELTTENMQYLTLKNSIADLNYFALTAELPFDTTGATNAAKAPWVLVGGSYSGALTAWTERVTKPSVMWAYYASSAVVETIGDYWTYYTPEILNMPQNCSTDIDLVVEHLDSIGMHGSVNEQAAAKEMFGLGGVAHYDDFMGALVSGPQMWQGIQFYENTGFFDFCDAVEGVNANSTSVPGASGVGLDAALAGYSNWMKNDLIPGYCYPEFSGTDNVECFDSYNSSSPLYSDISVDNAYGRQWDWFLCGGFGWWQNGAPHGTKTMASRLINNAYFERQCAEWFPTEDGVTYGLNAGQTYHTANHYTGGWREFEDSTRLIFVCGTNDPWRSSQVCSSIRPAGPQVSTKNQPILDVKGGYHTSDLITANGDANAGCAAVQVQVVSTIKEWVSEYPAER